jgi:phage terminase large subunit
VREIQRSLDQSVKRLIEEKIAAIGAEGQFRVRERHIEVLDPPGLIGFQGMQNHTAQTIKSLQGYTRAWVEEAQALSQRSLDLLTPTIREPGSELWFSWNPESPKDAVDRFFAEHAGDPDFLCVSVTHRNNPWFPDELKRDMERDRARDPGRWRHVWEGEYASRSARQVFRNWRVEPFATPEGVVFRFGADWGFANDPTVLVRCWLSDRTLYIDQAVAAVRCEVDATPRLFARVAGSRTWPITADPARPEMISYMRRAGFRMREAAKGPGSVEEGVRFLQSFDIVVHPDCDPSLAEELANYSFRTDPDTGEVLPLLEDRWNNCIDALRYALEALRRARTHEAPRPVPRRDGYWPEEEADGSWKVT